MAGERVDRPERDAEAGLALDEAPVAVAADGRGDRRAEADRVALEVRSRGPRPNRGPRRGRGGSSRRRPRCRRGRRVRDRSVEPGYAWSGRSSARFVSAHHSGDRLHLLIRASTFLGCRGRRLAGYRAGMAARARPRHPLVDARPGRARGPAARRTGFDRRGRPRRRVPERHDRHRAPARARRTASRSPSGAALAGSVPRRTRTASRTSSPIGWATVDRERFVAGLGAGGRSRSSPRRSASRGVRRSATGRPAGDVLVLEPDTEGRLAATLARSGEGPVAIYLRLGAAGSARFVAAAARARRRPVSTVQPGPLGPSVLLLGGPDLGPAPCVVGRGDPDRSTRVLAGYHPDMTDPAGFTDAPGAAGRRRADRRALHRRGLSGRPVGHRRAPGAVRLALLDRQRRRDERRGPRLRRRPPRPAVRAQRPVRPGRRPRRRRQASASAASATCSWARRSGSPARDRPRSSR